MKSCLYADFGFGARYFQVVDTGAFMVELYYVFASGFALSCDLAIALLRIVVLPLG
jgi:hypothetical protein